MRKRLPRRVLLAAIPIFAPLPLQTLERLASQLGEVRLPAGTLILRQGDPGDRFYVIADGEVEIEGKPPRPGRRSSARSRC